jgi:putative transposase
VHRKALSSCESATSSPIVWLKTATAARNRPRRSSEQLWPCRHRRLHVPLRREGHAVNKKRVQRLYREECLTVRRRGGRKRSIGTRRPIATPLAANQRWSLDFVSDQLTS